VRGPLGSEVPLVSDKLPRSACRASIDLLGAGHLLVGVPRPISWKRAPATGPRGVLAFNPPPLDIAPQRNGVKVFRFTGSEICRAEKD
jgi:hypothetical protein